MELVVFLLAVIITWCLLLALGVGVFWWKLDRANRVVPSQATPAPMHWLVSPSRSAQLHRRLRNAVAPGHVPPRKRERDPLVGSVTQLREELEAQATTVDHHLVLVAHRPRPQRRRELAALDGQVRQVEDLSVRLRHLAYETATRPTPDQRPIPETDVHLGRLAQSVGHQEQAVEELAALERANGLGDLEAILGARPTEEREPAPLSRPTPTPRPDGRGTSAPRPS